MRLPEKIDAVMVGAGVIGLALGSELARRGMKVAILDKEGVGAGASPVAGGMLAPVSEASVEHPQLLDFAIHNLQLYGDWIARLQRETGRRVDFRTDGTVFVALTRDDEQDLEHLHSLHEKRALRSRFITAEKLLELEPYLSPRSLCGLLVETDLHVDPRYLVQALAQQFEQLGGVMLAPYRVTKVTIESGRVTGVSGIDSQGTSFDLASACVVLAAGAWASVEIESPLSEAGVRAVRGQTVLLRGPELLRRCIRHPEVYLVPRDGGEVTVGATLEEVGLDPIATAGGAYHLLRWALQLVPGLDEHQVVSLPVGLRPAVTDHMPLIGPAGAEGFWAALAHYRSGILLAPGTAQHLAEWIVNGNAPTLLSPFDPLRGLRTT
ncbi:MAG: glycine oxidase ThiO [Acidobacteriota bacterium]